MDPYFDYLDKWIAKIVYDFIYSNKQLVLKNYYDNYIVRDYQCRFDTLHGEFQETYYELYDIDYDDDDNEDRRKEKRIFDEESTLENLQKDIWEENKYRSDNEYFDNESKKIKPIVVTKCNYVLGKLHGEYKKFNEYNGTLSELIEYNMGIIHGKKFMYNGNTNTLESYYVNGILDGNYIERSNNGIMKECHYVMGKLHGDYKEFMYDSFTNKGLVNYISCHYVNGLLHGEHVNNFKYSNAPWTITLYDNGKKNGKFIKYFDRTDYKISSKTGIMCETFYKNDKLHGIHKEWNKDGSLYKEIMYQDGLVHGKYKEYKNGKLYIECDHIFGKKHGFCIDHIHALRAEFVNDIQVS